MSDINKKGLSEIDICDLFITPAIRDAGWHQLQQFRREVPLNPWAAGRPINANDELRSAAAKFMELR